MHQLITAEQVHKYLDLEGKSIADFAREHNLYASTVYQVSLAVKKPVGIEAQRAAILLGIKAGNFPPTIQPPMVNEPQSQ